MEPLGAGLKVRHKTEQSHYRMSVGGDGQRDYMALEPGE